MKHILLALLIAFSPIAAQAQKHHVLADVGTAPGFSLTYTYTKVKWWSVGGGIHAYRFSGLPVDGKPLVPGIYGEARLNIRPEKKNQIFSFIDLGINLYKPEEEYYRDGRAVHIAPYNNGFGLGLGFGYLRRMTKRNGGPYASLKLLTDWYTVSKYSIVSVENDSKYLSMNASLSLSVGFKF